MAKIQVQINENWENVGYEPFKPIYRLQFADTRIKVYHCVTEHGKHGYLARTFSDSFVMSNTFNENLDTLTRDCCLKVVTFAHYIYENAQSYNH